MVRDEGVAARAEIMREKGTNRSAFLRGEVDKYTWVAEGSSYILSDVLAAILDAQLDRFDEIQARRARVSARYRARARGLGAGLGRAPEPGSGRADLEPPHLLPAVSRRGEPRSRPGSPPGARRARHLPLRAPSLVALRPHRFPEDAQLEVTDRVARTLLRLPLHPLLTDEDVDRVVASVLAFAA